MKFVKVETKNYVTHVKLNRPEIRNAFNQEMIAEITDVFSKIRSDARAVVLSGEGEAFCAGGDVEWMKSMIDYSVKENIADAEKLAAMFRAIHLCPAPVVGLVHGYAMGGGVGLTAACDIVAADSTTKFALSEVRLGIAPAVICPLVLEKTGSSFMRRYALTGDMFSASEALRGGLIHHVGDSASCGKFVDEILSSLAKSGPEAVRASKRLLQYCIDHGDWAERTRECARVIADRRVSPEGQEGLKSFLAKKDPAWRSK